MAEDDQFSPAIDLRLLILVVVLLGGVSLIPLALRSVRPSEHEGLRQSALGDQVVPVRLSQDPIEVVSGFASTNAQLMRARDFAGSGETSTNGDNFIYSRQEVANQVARHLTSRSNRAPGPPIVVLEVVVSGGSCAEDSEQRLRARYAVVSALSAAGFAPWDEEHIGYAELRRKDWRPTISQSNP